MIAGLRRLYRRLTDERGQVMTLYVFALPAALAVCALALDGGKFYVTRIHLQNAADAAALASVQDLGEYLAGVPGANPEPDVHTDANCYASMNRAPVGGCDAPPWPNPEMQQCNNPDWWSMTSAERVADMNCYSWPYTDKSGNVHNDQVEVRLRQTVALSFGGLPGIPQEAHPWARAVATYKPDVTGDTAVLGETTVVNVDPDEVVPGQPVTETIVENGTTSFSYETLPGELSTTVITTPGQTHTTTIVTAGTCTPGVDCGVAFAKSTACPAITYSGAGGGSIGSLKTNGGFQAKGAGSNPKTIDTLFLGKKGVAGCFDNQANVTFTHPVVGPFVPEDWPIPLPDVPTAVPLTQSTLGANECWNLSSAGIAGATKPGVYCTTGDLNLTKDYIGYTFFARCISVSAKDDTLQAPGSDPGHETLFYASGTTSACGGAAIALQGNANTLVGNLFAPNGAVTMSGGGVAGGKGFVEAQTLDISGNFASYLGLGPLTPGTSHEVVTTDPDTFTTVVNTGTEETVTHTTITGGTSYETVTTGPDTTIAGQTHTITITTTTILSGTTETTGTDGLGE